MLERTGRRLQLPGNRPDAQASRRGGSSASPLGPERRPAGRGRRRGHRQPGHAEPVLAACLLYRRLLGRGVRRRGGGAAARLGITANPTLVWLYWNVERVISAEIQRHAKRAEYGEGLLEALGTRLTKQYGNGFSARSLWDMRRFFTDFRILPAPVAESGGQHILPSLLAESASAHIGQPSVDKSALPDMLQPVAVKSSKRPIRQPLAAESEDRITIDFSQHFRLGWTHYRILLSVEAGLKRGFYFEQAAQQRWSKRELQRQIDRALFERVALSGQRGCPHRYPQALVG